MKIKQLEYYLERGNVFGFVKDTTDINVVGWFLLKKLKHMPRYKEILDPICDLEIFQEQENLEKTPYYIEVCELGKSFFELDDSWPEEEDYIMNEYYRFSTLEDVEHFFRENGKSIQEIKWGADFLSM